MKKILIVNSSYYKNISKNLVISARNELIKAKLSTSLLEVPGVFEIPVAIRKNINKFDGFCAWLCTKGQTPF